MHVEPMARAAGRDRPGRSGAAVAKPEAPAPSDQGRALAGRGEAAPARRGRPPPTTETTKRRRAQGQAARAAAAADEEDEK
jgi:hypothetical protein